MQKPPIQYARISAGYNDKAVEYLHLLYCTKSDLQFIVKASIESGFSDYEEVGCPCCKSKLIKVGAKHHGIATTSTPEIIGCLIPAKKRLLLVYSEFASETLKIVMREHLVNQNLTKLYSQVGEYQSSTSFLKDCEHLKRKGISKKFSIKFWRLKKLAEKKLESAIEKLGKQQVKSTSLGFKKDLQSKKLLEQIKKDFLESKKSYQKSLERKLSSPKKSLKTSNLEEELRNLSATQNLKTEQAFTLLGSSGSEDELNKASRWKYRPQGFRFRQIQTVVKVPVGLNISFYMDWLCSEAENW